MDVINVEELEAKVKAISSRKTEVELKIKFKQDEASKLKEKLKEFGVTTLEEAKALRDTMETTLKASAEEISVLLLKLEQLQN